MQVSEQAVYENVHEYQINDIKFLPGRDGMSLVSASCDGHVSVLDIESGSHYSLCDLNPGGWVDGVSNERNWKMMQCLAVHEAQPHLSWAGDNRGNVRSACVLQGCGI
jgi:WD40 repeat protein